MCYRQRLSIISIIAYSQFINYESCLLFMSQNGWLINFKAGTLIVMSLNKLWNHKFAFHSECEYFHDEFKIWIDYRLDSASGSQKLWTKVLIEWLETFWSLLTLSWSSKELSLAFSKCENSIFRNHLRNHLLIFWFRQWYNLCYILQFWGFINTVSQVSPRNQLENGFY